MTSPVPVITIGPNGISKPQFSDVLAGLVAGYQGIYGDDVYIFPDSIDGQWLGIVATAIDDANCQTVSTYNAFSPSTAQGIGLSRVVKINGIARDVATNSTAIVTVIGQAGIVITNGIIADVFGNQWSLPASITMPLSGLINVTATCQTAGAIVALAGTLTTIVTQTPGWQTVNNIEDATPGAPVESDAQLRIQQSISTSIPALDRVDSLLGAISAITGVQWAQVYENDTDTINSNGIPGSCLACVVSGGALQTIVNTIGLMKGPGVGTYGNTTGTYTNTAGTSKTIAYFIPTDVPISVLISLTALTGYTTDIQAQIASTVSAYINALGGGQNVMRTRLFVPAQLSGGQNSNTFEIIDVQIAGNGLPVADQDVVIPFNSIAVCNPSFVLFSVSV